MSRIGNAIQNGNFIALYFSLKTFRFTSKQSCSQPTEHLCNTEKSSKVLT